MTLYACTTQRPDTAAPLNDKATLEKLAAAYEKVSQSFPVSPVNLIPKARRDFVEQVFTECGYGYSATLLELAKIEPAAITQYHKDIRDLLFMPHYATDFEESRRIYSEAEMKAIEQINTNFAAADRVQ